MGLALSQLLLHHSPEEIRYCIYEGQIPSVRGWHAWLEITLMLCCSLPSKSLRSMQASPQNQTSFFPFTGEVRRRCSAPKLALAGWGDLQTLLNSSAIKWRSVHISTWPHGQATADRGKEKSREVQIPWPCQASRFLSYPLGHESSLWQDRSYSLGTDPWRFLTQNKPRIYLQGSYRPVPSSPTTSCLPLSPLILVSRPPLSRMCWDIGSYD